MRQESWQSQAKRPLQLSSLLYFVFKFGKLKITVAA
jgi:hypothetical protein